MKFLSIYFICVINFLTISCDSIECKKSKDLNSVSEPDTSVISKTNIGFKYINCDTSFSDSIIFTFNEISHENYALKVETYYLNDDVDLLNDFIANIVLKQEITFLISDRVHEKIIFPVKKIDVKTVKGRCVNIQENNVCRISLVQGKRRSFYKISGSGILGSQSEFYGIYSLKGSLLWYSYSTSKNLNGRHKEDPNEGNGDFYKILKKYGVTEKEFNKPARSILIDIW